MSSQIQLGEFAPPMKPGLSQWHTPQPLADRMAEWCELEPGNAVLEPCAGGGNIVRACTRQGVTITAVEIDPEWCAVLGDQRGRGETVICADFLAMALPTYDTEKFDIVVMNSPYEKGADATWIAHAIMFAPRVVALVPSRILYGAKKHRQLWSRYRLARVAHLVRRPIFKGTGGKFDLCVVDVRREPPRKTVEVEWWP